jgi:hypothetical protein
MGAGPSILDQATFKEMGLLSWAIIDLAINWGGWAVSAALKVGVGPVFFFAVGGGSRSGRLLRGPCWPT